MLLNDHEIDHIETIGDLKRAIASVPEDTPLEDGMQCGMYLRYHPAVPREGMEFPETAAYVEYR